MVNIIEIFLSLFFLKSGQSCVNESRFKEQVLHVRQPGPSYSLQCPLRPVQSQNAPVVQLAWLKDCQQLPKQVGKTSLEFSSVSLKDQGNYTCIQQGNDAASFTVRLVVKGEYELSVHPSVFFTWFSMQCHRKLVLISSSHWVSGGVHPGQVTSPPQGHIKTNQPFTLSHNIICMFLFCWRKQENMAGGGVTGKTCKPYTERQQPSFCEVTAIIRAVLL